MDSRRPLVLQLLLLWGLVASAASAALASPVSISDQPVNIQEVRDKQVNLPPWASKTAHVGSPLAGRSLLAADKLKRGLKSFIKERNPGSFFVPNTLGGNEMVQAAIESAAREETKTAGAESAAIINEPMADVVIKGPNRLTQTRPLGIPLRWGR